MRRPRRIGGTGVSSSHTMRSILAAMIVLAGCAEPGWQVVHEDLPGALLSVWGTSADDVWAVGADAGDGPLVLHWDGDAWTRLDTGHDGTLWWVFGFAGGPVFMGGDGGAILRYQGGAFTPMTTPGNQTVFGIWGAAPDDLWAVGGDSSATGGFAWRFDGEAWREEPTLPADVAGRAAVWKVFGRGPDDVRLVGSSGVALAWDGVSLQPEETGVGSSLFTVHANAARYAAVGGLSNGVIVEGDASGWRVASADPVMPSLSGVVLGEGDEVYAVGGFGSVYARRAGGAWELEPTDDLGVDQNLHAVWLDPEGGVWAAGGQTFSVPLTEGVLIHRGEPVAVGGIR